MTRNLGRNLWNINTYCFPYSVWLVNHGDYWQVLSYTQPGFKPPRQKGKERGQIQTFKSWTEWDNTQWRDYVQCALYCDMHLLYHVCRKTTNTKMQAKCEDNLLEMLEMLEMLEECFNGQSVGFSCRHCNYFKSLTWCDFKTGLTTSHVQHVCSCPFVTQDLAFIKTVSQWSSSHSLQVLKPVWHVNGMPVLYLYSVHIIDADAIIKKVIVYILKYLAPQLNMFD